MACNAQGIARMVKRGLRKSHTVPVHPFLPNNPSFAAVHSAHACLDIRTPAKYTACFFDSAAPASLHASVQALSVTIAPIRVLLLLTLSALFPCLSVVGATNLLAQHTLTPLLTRLTIQMCSCAFRCAELPWVCSRSFSSLHVDDTSSVSGALDGACKLSPTPNSSTVSLQSQVNMQAEHSLQHSARSGNPCPSSLTMPGQRHSGAWTLQPLTRQHESHPPTTLSISTSAPAHAGANTDSAQGKRRKSKLTPAQQQHLTDYPRQ